MKLHLNYTPPELKNKISHTDKVLLTGSCFAESIGDYMKKYKFNCLINPNGILFNPISIANALSSYIKPEPIDKNDIVKQHDLFFNYSYHGSVSAKNESDLIKKTESILKTTHLFLKEADHLIITFGSAFVFRNINTGKIVANCHKQPQHLFKKELLKSRDIIITYNLLLSELKKTNQSLSVIFTVSPVKYIRDGIIENNLSKAILIESVHEIINNNTNCFYFPAYELITDDLRDYRFYKEDLAHPNDMAVQYVWEKLAAAAFSKETLELNKQISEITEAAKHNPIHKDSEEYDKFKKTFLKKCLNLEIKHPNLNFSYEKELFT